MPRLGAAVTNVAPHSLTHWWLLFLTFRLREFVLRGSRLIYLLTTGTNDAESRTCGLSANFSKTWVGERRSSPGVTSRAK